MSLTVIVHPQRETDVVAPLRRFNRAGRLRLLSLGLLFVALAINLFGGSVDLPASQTTIGSILFVAILFIAVFTVPMALLVKWTNTGRRVRYLEEEGGWISRLGFFTGPYDESGLEGAETFFQRCSHFGRTPHAYLAVRNNGMAVVSIDIRTLELFFPFESLQKIDLFPGSVKWLPYTGRRSARKLGQIVLTDKSGRWGALSGLSVIPLEEILSKAGISVQDTLSPPVTGGGTHGPT